MSEKTFTFRNGTTVTLRKISQFMLTRLMVDNSDKYPIPEKLVKVGTRQQEKLIPDYDNSNWNRLVQAQKEKDQMETLANLSVYGIVDDVPPDLFELYLDLAESTQGSGVSDNFVKSLWILDMLEHEDELSELQEAILGINNVTEKGLVESQEKFQHTD